MERFVVRHEDGHIRIDLRGEIVMDLIQDCKLRLEQLLSGDGCRDVVVDLGGVTFMDSSAIGFLIGLRRRTAACGRLMRIENPSHHIVKLFDMLRLSDFFAMGRDREGGSDRST